MWRRGVDGSPAANVETGVSFHIRIGAGNRGACVNVHENEKASESIHETLANFTVLMLRFKHISPG